MRSSFKGNISIVGIGFPSLMSALAEAKILSADVVVGYNRYIEEIESMLLPHQKVHQTGMRQEKERVQYAVDMALDGNNVCIVCSGDPTLFGMAALAYELSEGMRLKIDVVPSVTAAMAASACLGAVVTEDTVLLSLSDQLTPWSLIQKRIDAVNMGDFVCAIYNPISKTRVTQLPYALSKFRERGDLLVGAVKNAFREGNSSAIYTIDTFDISVVDMFTLVMVGNTTTKLIDGKMVTPRGYNI